MVDGWHTKNEVRKEGNTAGTSDTYFFNPGGTRMPKVFKRGGKGGKDTGEPSRSSDGDLQEMLQDSCIDWGGLSAREVAAAFMMLKGGSLC